MLIRCEKCSTTYELEERLIPPGGAPVQCSRCEHVFRAYPPSRSGPAGAAEGERRPGLELVPPPADELPPEPAEPTAELDERPAAEVAAPGVEAGGDAAPTPDDPAPRPEPPPAAPPPSTYKPPPGPVIPPGKPVRKVPNPELEGTDMPSVAPMPRRTVSLDVTPRKRSKSSWIVPAAVGLVALLAIAGTISWWQERSAAKDAERAAAAATAAAAPARAVTRERQEAVTLLMRDDAASVERAAAQLDGLVRREQAPGARADRALSLAILSQQARDQADRMDARATALEEERSRAAATAGPQPAARASELAAEIETVKAEVPPLRERAERLLSEARSELEALPAQARGDVAAARARAWVQLVSGAHDKAGEIARTAPAAGEDPWLGLAAIVAELREGAGGDAHERAAGRLEQLAEKHPGFVRPLVLAGRIRAGLGDGERALADLDAALKRNPQHAEARRMRADLAPSFPEAGQDSNGGEGAASPGPSSVVNDHSQAGKAPAAPAGR